MKQQTIGLVGLGLMGAALAERALHAGFSVTGFDLNAARRRALRRMGGHPVASAAEVATTCRRILFSLPTTDVVESVIQEMGDKLVPASTIIDTTTGVPAQTVALALQLTKRRVRYLDATIVGSSAETRAGQVVVMVGGSVKTFTACRDVFDMFSRQAFHVGESGSGARMKLVVNLVLGLNRAVLAEGLAFATSIGVSPSRALEILKAGAAYSRAMDTKGGKMIARDFSPQAKLSQHLKDVRIILSLGRGAGAKLPLSTLHRKLLEHLEAAGHGELDNSAILKAFE